MRDLETDWDAIHGPDAGFILQGAWAVELTKCYDKDYNRQLGYNPTVVASPLVTRTTNCKGFSPIGTVVYHPC